MISLNLLPMLLDKLVGWVLRYERWWLYLALPLVSLVMHWKVWSLELQGMHVWRQAQTQQTIDSYVEEDFNILNPRNLARGSGDGIVRLEFPLYQWMVALVAKFTGGGVIVSRLFSFLLGWLGIWGVHRLLKVMFRESGIALLGAFFMCFSPVWYYYTACPLPDVLALCLGIWGMALLMELVEEVRWGKVIGLAACFGAATLVKLPYGMFYVASLVWWVALVVDKRNGIAWRQILGSAMMLLLSLVPAAAWYAVAIPEWGPAGVAQGIFSELVEWDRFPGILSYHAQQMFPRTIISIATVPFVAIGLVKGWQWLRKGKTELRMALPWLALGGMFFLFYAYEFFTIGLYHDYYLLPIVPSLVGCAALGAWTLVASRQVIWKVLALTLIFAVPIMTYRRIHPRWEEQNAEFDLDWKIHKAELRAAVPDDALVVAGPDDSHTIFLYYIHKKGWSWDDNQRLPADRLAGWVKDGAQFFYCNDRKYDEDSTIKPFLGPEIGHYGSVKVYPLVGLDLKGK
jgi:hypothetical protein